MITLDMIGAKSEPFESIKSHMLRAGIIAKIGLENSYFENYKNVLKENIEGFDDISLINFVSYIVAMHDIGKIHPCFQEIIPNMKEMMIKEGVYENTMDAKWRHDFQSANYIYNFKFFENRGIPKKLAEYLSEVILKHHDRKKYNSCDIEDLFEDNETGFDFWRNSIKEMENIVFNSFPFDGGKIKGIKNMDIVCFLIWGYIIVCDWLASSSSFSRYDISVLINNTRIVEELFARYGFETIKQDFSKIDYSDLLNVGKENLILRAMQKWSVDYCKDNTFDFCIIEGGTGVGKTSIGLYMALSQMKETEGLYFALPMQTMVNSKYFELRDIFKKFNMHLTLLHGNRDLVEDVENEYSYYSKDLNKNVDVNNFLTKSSRRGLLNRYIVGTIDQLLYSVLPNKFFILRLIGLIGKTIIIDEVHTYDLYTAEILSSLLAWCKVLHIKVIFMSATLTKELKEKYLSKYLDKDVEIKNEGYPLITVVKNNEVTEIPIEDIEKDKVLNVSRLNIIEDIQNQAEIIKAYYEQGSNIIVYKNTVNEAQKLYRACKELGIEDITLCHSRFTVKDRTLKEQFIVNRYGKNTKNRPIKSVVISTQVLEASMDIDFDIGFSDIAPIDILIQRMGRVCRFDINGIHRNSFIVFTSNETKYGVSEYIYPKIFLINTDKYLIGKMQMSVPKDLRESINSVYSDIDFSNEAIFKLYTEEMTKNSIKESMGIVNSLRPPNETRFSLCSMDYEILNEDDKKNNFYATRIFDASYTVLCIDKENLSVLDSYYFDFSFEHYKEIMKYTLSVSARYIKDGLKINNSTNTIMFGKERLNNILILPLDNGKVLVEDDKLFGYKYSYEYGFEVLRKE